MVPYWLPAACNGTNPHVQPVGGSEAVAIAARALKGGRRRVALIGPEGSGKSRALDALAGKFEGRRLVRLAVPRRGDDAAVVGLVSLGSQLTQWDPDLMDRLREPATSWGDKLDRVLKALARTKGVLLLDDPRRGRSIEPPSVFTRHAEELTQSVLSVDSVDVVVASRSVEGLPSVQIVRVVPDSDAWEELRQLDGHERIREATALLLLGDTPSELSRYGSLELRLIVACVLAGHSPAEFVERRWDPREIVLTALEGNGHRPLRQLIGKLAFARTAFDDDLLRCFGADALTDDEQQLLRRLILLNKHDGQILHDLIGRHAIAQRWSDQEPEVTHRTLAEWHRQRFETSRDRGQPSAAVRHEVEVIHHLTEARDAEAVLGASLFFVDQYDALGKALSVAGRYADAVTAYQRAIEHDADDAYAHHYLAYNLDCLAVDEPRIEKEYRTARRLDPGHVWYHGRLVCFLVTVGRMTSARDAWGEALSELAYDDDDPFVFDELHRPVAQLLLHRGQLVLAEHVLRDVAAAASGRAWFAALQRRLHAMQEAEREELVFPPVVEDAERWKGPHLLRDPADRKRIKAWMPGRITNYDERELRIRLAERNGDVVRYTYRSLSMDELGQIAGPAAQGFALPAGTFVELLTLTDDTQRLLSWQRQATDVPSLGAIFPRPDRFLRRAFAGTTS